MAARGVSPGPAHREDGGIVRTLLIVLGARTARTAWDLLVSPWHLDEQIEGFPVPTGAIALARPRDHSMSELDGLIDRFRYTAGAVAPANRPLVLAGDCLTALGLVAGLQRRHRDVSVVWLDAHGDFNTPAISVSGYLAGMSLAMLCGRAPEPICDPLGLRPVPDEHAVLIGARDLDPAERDALESSRVLRLAADPAAVCSPLTELPAGDVYLHVDVDIIDSEELPGLRFPADAGPSFSVVEECLAQIVDAAPPIAACIACAWAPERIADAPTRGAITRLAAVIGAELEWAADRVGRG
jgi:arginase